MPWQREGEVGEAAMGSLPPTWPVGVVVVVWVEVGGPTLCPHPTHCCLGGWGQLGWVVSRGPLGWHPPLNRQG